MSDFLFLHSLRYKVFRVVIRPDALPKRRSVSLVPISSSGVGRQNRITSSAYIKILGIARRGCSGASTPAAVAAETSLPSTSTTSTNVMGESGSPCRSPWRCQIGGPGSPFSKILVLAEDKRIAIQAHHLSLNPYARSISKMNGQATESNAFVRSRRTLGSFSWCRTRIDEKKKIVV
jgi:hypothetical protein